MAIQLLPLEGDIALLILELLSPFRKQSALGIHPASLGLDFRLPAVEARFTFQKRPLQLAKLALPFAQVLAERTQRMPMIALGLLKRVLLRTQLIALLGNVPLQGIEFAPALLA